VRWLGPVEALDDVLHEHSVDEVAFFPPHHDPVHEIARLQACETLGIPALFSVSMEPVSDSSPQVATRHYKPFLLFDVSPRPATALLAKQLFDTTASALGILLLSPLLVLTTLAVWISMGRPIFFSQKRAGLYGREFRMVKFRTMTRDAEHLRAAGKVMNELSGPVFKSTTDPRITPLGRLLRRWSLDELPQLFNVLGGAMSLVGPRPLPIDEQREIRGWRRRRLSMKPGITGLWQVSGRSDVDFEQWMRLDLRYVDEWSLRLDAILLLKTFKAVISGKGAR
jgi:lipopolysaccharide/colanic/teichoic acid biosynthesis glycosyltransferase